MLIGNVTGLTSQGVFNLGPFSSDGYITVKSLINSFLTLNIYQNTLGLGGIYGIKIISTPILIPQETKNITITSSS